MKKARLFVLTIFLTILLSSCANAQEDNRPAPTVPPSVISFPALAPSPMPEPELGIQAKIYLALNHMVREELDYMDDSLIEEIPKQDTLVRVFRNEAADFYIVFMALQDRILQINIRNDLPDYFLYDFVRLYDEEMPDDIYEYSLGSDALPVQAQLLDEFAYTFNPDCELTYENKYFYMWNQIRNKIIEWELDSSGRAQQSGEYTLLFCDYSELYFPAPEEAHVIVITIKDACEGYCYYSFNAKDITFMKELILSEKQAAYYKAREFDRETVYVEAK